MNKYFNKYKFYFHKIHHQIHFNYSQKMLIFCKTIPHVTVHFLKKNEYLFKFALLIFHTSTHISSWYIKKKRF